VGTGGVTYTVNDYGTAGPNVLSLSRYYNNQTPIFTYAQSLGTQWRTTYDRYTDIAPDYLLGVSPTTIVNERPDGSQLVFVGVNGAYTTDKVNDAILTYSGSTYTIKFHDDTVETYIAVGKKGALSSITYRGGYTQTMAYNGSGQLSTVTDSYGRKLTFTYTGSLLTQVTTPDSLVLTYGYTSGNLTSVSYNTSPVTSQTYNYANTALPNALTSITDENGNTFQSWTYDTSNRGLTSQRGTGSNADITTIVYNDSTDGSRTVTNALGQQEKYTLLGYSGLPLTLEITRVNNGQFYALTYDINNCVASVEDWNQNTTTFTNDLHCDPTTIVEASGTSLARTTTITYDPTWVHLPKTIVSPLLTTGYTYDSNGNMLTVTGTDTTSQTVPYSTNGQTRTWTLTWNNFLPASITPPKGSGYGSTFTFDSTGALTAITDALSHEWHVTSHTGGGQPLTAVDPNSVTTTYTYSTRNWPLTNTVDTAAGNLTTTNTYDAAGNLTKVALPDGSYFTNTYDTAHRLTKIADSFGNSMNYTLDAAGDATASNIENPSGTVTRGHTATFDTLRRKLTDTNGTNWQTSFSYLGNGNLYNFNPPSNGFTYPQDALNRKTSELDFATVSFTYDAHDNPLSVNTTINSLTSYVYDGFGDVIQETSPDRGITVYHYDADANLTQKVDALSVVTNYTYDALDRTLTRSYPADASENVAYTYDQTGTGFAFGIGRLTSLTDMAGSLTRTYDERGNLITEKRTNGSNLLTTTYGYDSVSRLASITYPSGALVSYVRDAMGRVTSVTDKPSGASSATTLASGVTYEPLGPWLGLTYGNGIVETATYDADYSLLTLKDIGTATAQNISYGYPLMDQPWYYTDNLNSGNTMFVRYDGLYRVTAGQSSTLTPSYTYDYNGNRTAMGTPNVTYTYTPNTNRLATIVNGSTTTTVTTNANGSITGFSPAYGTAAVTSLSYNNGGRLTSVSGSSGVLGSYVYDALGNRFSKTVGTNTTLYQYSPGMTLLEESTGGTATDYIYLNGRPIAMLTGSTFTYLHGNNIGTPLVATNASQAVVWRQNYLPFGETLSTSGSFVVNLRFPGQYYDAESGFNHNGFRDYVPALGRYLESDPIGIYGGGQSNGFNTYAYVANRPMTLTDPTGRYWGLFFAAVDLTIQLGNNGGNIHCVNWWEVAAWAGPDLFKGAKFVLGALEEKLTFEAFSAFLADESGTLNIGWLAGDAVEEEAAAEETIAEFGPFYRLGDTAETLNAVQDSGTLMGQPARNIFQSDFPTVKAYLGPLPEGATGFEFTTPLAPRSGFEISNTVLWGAGEGATIVGEWASIPVTILRQTIVP